MKNIYTILFSLLISASAFAQMPEQMSYQAIIRDASDQLKTNSGVGMQISILQGSADGTAVYVERHFPSTNANGLVNVQIGTGTVVSGTFADIDWANGPFFIKTETDMNGGSSYTISGTSQLLSVPYALHSKTAEHVTNDLVNDADANPSNELISGVAINGAGKLVITEAGTPHEVALPNDTDWNTNISGRVYNLDDKVGIGTSSPREKLDVDDGGSIEVDGEYKYETAKEHYMSFAPITLRSFNPSRNDYEIANYSNYYGYFKTGSGILGYAGVPIYLPDGAIIKELEAWIYDNSTDYVVRVALYKHSLGTKTSTRIVNVESSAANASADIQNLTSSSSYQAVDNTKYAYYLMFTGRETSPDTRFYGAKIKYTVKKAD